MWGDAAATAGNILGSETLFRVGLAGEMPTCVCDVALALILYVLLRPVSRELALLAAFFRLTFVAVYAVAKLFEIAALAALEGSSHLQGLGASQLQDLAYVSLRVHSLGYGASLLFFGICCILFGHLIHRSGYLPRILGILLAVAGYGYVVFSVAQLLSPAFAGRVLFPWVIPMAFVAETGLGLWLLVKGVSVVVSLDFKRLSVFLVPSRNFIGILVDSNDLAFVGNKFFITRRAFTYSVKFI